VPEGRPERLMKLAVKLFGRRTLWRLGRLAYAIARGEGPNRIETNGEAALQRHLARHATRTVDVFVCLDIGAFIGYWAESLVSACRDEGVERLHLIAFEPSETSREELDRCFERIRGTYWLEVRASAVGDFIGTALFDMSAATAGANSLVTDTGNSSATSVSITTVSQVFAECAIEYAHFVKSDVEGFDPLVIKGALPLLREGRIGVLQFEYNVRWIASRSFLKDIFELIAGLPYQIGKLVSDGVELHEEWHPELERFIETNYVLVRNDLVAAVGARRGRFDAYNTYATAEMSDPELCTKGALQYQWPNVGWSRGSGKPG
jgi:FkbM family methyltransferase